MMLSLLSVESMDQAEDHLIFSASTDDGQTLDEEQARRLLTLPGSVQGSYTGEFPPILDALSQARQPEIQRNISERNARFFHDMD